MIESLCNTCKYKNEKNYQYDVYNKEKICDKGHIILKQDNYNKYRKTCLGCGEYVKKQINF